MYQQNKRSIKYKIAGFFVALICAVTFFGCGGGGTPASSQDVSKDVSTPTIGSLNVNVDPLSATVVVTGPESFTQTFTGNKLLTDLKPGQYTAEATEPNYEVAASQINVVAGETSSVFLVLQSKTLADVGGPVGDTGSEPVPAPTLGSLNVNVSPSATTVVVMGPDSFTQTFIGNQLLIDLKPGQYNMTATSPAFGNAAGQINVVAGQTSYISLILVATPIVIEAPRAVYRDGDGNLIPINASALEAGQFVFYAWEEDRANGIVPSNLNSMIISDPGKPLVAEQMETAPSFTQNLAAAWLGFRDAKGVIRPVIGADVRWEIDQFWSGRVNSMQFGTSDDNRIALGYGVFDDQADTRSNNARLAAERFPLVETEYPLYNQTGIGTPFADGFTWVTLFSPDATASGRIVAVATVDGEEVGKQILYKKFAPAPKLQITKTVDSDIVNIVDGVAVVNWTVTVKNVGTGDAENVDLNDFLASGAESYCIHSLPSGSIPVGDGFTYSFPLVSELTSVEDSTKTMTFTGEVTEAGTYCNEAQVLSYSNSDFTWTPVDLEARACFTALESKVSIVKDFVSDDNTTSLGHSLTVSANTPAKLRVRVINSGTGVATGVLVNDVLTSGNPDTYQLLSVSSGTANGSDGFDTSIGDLAAPGVTTLLFTVAASEDGEYCDTATVSSTSGVIGISSDSACLTVATPNLEITKTDSPDNVLPSASYTSTIVVHNSGNFTAKNVAISDLLGYNSDVNVWAIYVSSNLNGVTGTFASNIVTTSGTVDILAGESLTFTVVSRIPFGAVSGNYCDTATVTSSNAVTKQASDCVYVPSFSAFQTQLIDLGDPVAVGSKITYFSTLYIEALSNEGVHSNQMKYSFGLVSPTVLGIPGVFQVTSTKVYLDTMPIRDLSTGLVISDASSPTAALLTAGSDYTVDNTTEGLQLIDMTPSVVLQPNTALYLVHEVLIPSGTPTYKMYTTSYIWESVGLVDPTHLYKSSSSEPTTVLP